MTSNSEIPQWAFPRALDLAGLSRVEVRGMKLFYAFARYISLHEEPPVDPLWDEAMAFTSGRGWNGSSPILPMVKFAYAALRRGIELGKAEAPHDQ